jgi:hypothetical protein
MVKRLAAKNPEAVLFDSRTESAIIGIGHIGHKLPVAVYSKKALLSVAKEFGIAELDIDEYYNWHFSGLYAGANTPVIIDDVFEVT